MPEAEKIACRAVYSKPQTFFKPFVEILRPGPEKGNRIHVRLSKFIFVLIEKTYLWKQVSHGCMIAR
jgi:hypothetical protein